MAARFWVAGGTGNWSSTTNWSATTGGASGASVPGSTDTATFDAASGAVTATVDSSVTIQTLTMTGFTGTLAFGTNTISLNSTGTVFTGATTFTVTGTPVINVTSTGSTAITVTTTAMTEANAISFNFTGGTYALTIVAGSIRNLNFTGFSGSVTLGNTNIYGNLVFSSGMTIPSAAQVVNFKSTSATTRTITTNARTIGINLTFNGAGGTWQFQDAVTVDPLRTVTVTTGTLDLNNKSLVTGFFIIGGTATRGLLFGTSGTITCNGAGGLLFQQGLSTGLTQTGNPVIYISNSGSVATTVTASPLTENQSPSFYFTTGSYALSFFTTSGSAKNVDFTGFSGTWGATSTATIYGNLTLSTGMTLTTSDSLMTFGATSGTQTITSNAKTMDFPLTFNGVGGTFQLQDALLMGTSRTLIHTNGTIDLNGKTLTVGTAYTTATGTKNLTFNGGTLVCPNAAVTAFNNAVPTGFTTTAGTGTGKISMTAATAKTFVGGGSTFNCTLSNDGAGALTISGANTFTNIANGVQPTSFVFPIATTQTVTNWNVSGTAGNLVTITSGTAGVPALLSKASGTVSSNYLSLKDSTATGGATWYAGANSTNVSGNLGWIFSSAPATNTGNFFFMF